MSLLLKQLVEDVFFGIKDSLSGWWVAIRCWKAEAQKLSNKPPPPKAFSQIAKKRNEKREDQKDSDGSMMGIIVNTIMTAAVALLITFMIETVWVNVAKLFGNRFTLGTNVSTFVLQVLWWVPSMVVIKLTSIINNNEVADKVFLFKYGRPKFTSFEVTVSEFVFSTVYQSIFLVQAAVICMIVPWPLVATLLDWIHYSLFYALYAFEYKWALLGIPGHQRVAQIENNWPYYFAFGLPVHLATAFWESLYTRTMAFTLLFPFSILGSTAAHPPHAQFAFPVHIMFPSVYLTNEAYKFVRSAWSHKKRPVEGQTR